MSKPHPLVLSAKSAGTRLENREANVLLENPGPEEPRTSPPRPLAVFVRQDLVYTAFKEAKDKRCWS